MENKKKVIEYSFRKKVKFLTSFLYEKLYELVFMQAYIEKLEDTFES